jgi:hypothetical protein
MKQPLSILAIRCIKTPHNGAQSWWGNQDFNNSIVEQRTKLKESPFLKLILKE